MDCSQFFFTLFCMVFFCLGLNKIMEENQILHFLRKPFENLGEEIETKQSILKITRDLNSFREHDLYLRGIEIYNLESQIFILKLKYYLVKPLVLCITCFASIWGASVFIALNGFNSSLLPWLIISCIASAYIQTVIYAKINI